MSRQFKGMTLEEHKALGERVCAVEQELGSIWNVFLRAYGCTRTRKAEVEVKKAIRAVNKMKCVLDDIVCEEHRGDYSVQPEKCYYGKGLAVLS